MSKNKERYVVGALRCNCHPETCCCSDYVIHLENGVTYTNPKRICSGSDRDGMEILVKMANKGLKRKKK